MSEKRDIVIIGCGAGGGTAAQFARKTDRKAAITIYEQGPYPQYSKCGLPYAISGDIPSFQDLIEFNADWFTKARIDLHLDTTVTNIDSKKKQITVKNEHSTTQKTYSTLIIATGAKPTIPPIKQITKNEKLVKGVFTLRTIQDAEQIAENAKEKRKATIIGAGLIGLEMADCLQKKKMEVTVIEALPHILANNLDEDMITLVTKQLHDNLTLFTNHLATEIKTKNNIVSMVIIQDRKTKNIQEIPTDLLIIATGTIPVIDLAKQAGCDIGETKGIKVNHKAETSQQHIYAVGDCTEYIDYVTEKPMQVGLGSIAVRQGIAAGVNAAGGNYTLPKGALMTSTSEFFDIQIASVGPCSHLLSDRDVISGKYNGSSLPEYFPGGKPITVKTTIDSSTGNIISAQAVGENAAQRINTYATAMLGNLDISRFRTLETAYAPPIAPTLDVVTLAADIAMMKYQRKKLKKNKMK